MQYDELNRLIQRTDSQNYRTRYSYDSVGNVARIEDPRGTQWEYEYLPNNLLQELSLTGATGETYSVSYTYDAAGNRLQASDRDATINYHPDALNRLTAIDRYFDGAAYQTGYQYEKNLLTGVKYPGSSTYLEYTYNQRNLVSGVSGFTQEITYHADGSLKATRYANEALTTYEYDQNRRLNDLMATINDTEILTQHYQFDLVD
jgi:YD repeat-containing protein